MSFWNTCILAYCRLGIAGLSPKAPGTAGSALAALLAPLLFLPLPLWGRLLFLAVIVVTGGLAATRAEILLGRTDPGEVVIDELVGVWIALLPLGAGQWSWPGLVWAFALFRLFDIWKPWPVHASETGCPQAGASCWTISWPVSWPCAACWCCGPWAGSSKRGENIFARCRRCPRLSSARRVSVRRNCFQRPGSAKKSPFPLRLPVTPRV